MTKNSKSKDPIVDDKNKISVPPSGLRVIVREVMKDKAAVIAFIIAVLIILVAVVGSMFIPKSATTDVNIMEEYAMPGTNGMLLGADQSGRSVLDILLVGARNSIFMGVSVALLIEIFGLIIGLISAYFGGLIDAIIMRIVDFFMVLPSLMIIIVLVTIVPNYTAFSLVIIMASLSWMGTARLMRSQVLSQAKREYVAASKTSGSSNMAIMFTGILPNISSFIITDLTLTIASMIGFEVSLSYLGFGLPSSTPSLGTLINYANDPEVLQTKPWIWMPAVLILLILSLSINFFGQALRRAADARQRLA